MRPPALSLGVRASPRTSVTNTSSLVSLMQALGRSGAGLLHDAGQPSKRSSHCARGERRLQLCNPKIVLSRCCLMGVCGGVPFASAFTGAKDISVITNEDGTTEPINEKYYLIMTSICVCTFFFNVNAAMLSVYPSRYCLNIQVAYVNAVCTWTHYQTLSNNDWYVKYDGAWGRKVNFSALQQLSWCFTTPVMLLLVQNLHAYSSAALPKRNKGKPVEDAGAKSKQAKWRRAYLRVDRLTLVLADELMIACGLLIPFTKGLESIYFIILSMMCFFFIMFHSVRALLDISTTRQVDTSDSALLVYIAVFMSVAWSGYPISFFLAQFGVITSKRLHELYMLNDLLTKIMYSMVISTGSLRFIEMLEKKTKVSAMNANSMQRAFFFNITHELRTPLNSIIGFNTLAMESGQLTTFLQSFIGASLTSAEALLSLINQILDFAKFESTKDPDAPQGDVVELANNLFTLKQLSEQVTNMAQRASSTGTLLVTTVDPKEFHTKFAGDYFRLRQCCANLVDNAIKYSEKSGQDAGDQVVRFDIAVTNSGDRSKKRLTFTVIDDGVGIPESKQHTLFVPFSQPSEGKTKHKQGGTGLGLVITKSIIEYMGGTIDFESSEGKGTKFWFTVDFPFGKWAEEQDDDKVDPSETDFTLDEEKETLSANARIILHPELSKPVKEQVINLLECYGARAGTNYVKMSSGSDIREKIKQASSTGVPIVIHDYDNLKDTLEVIEATKYGGCVVFGLPYQLAQLHKSPTDKTNVVMVLKPIRPSEFQGAIAKLAQLSSWDVAQSHNTIMHESLGEEEANAMLERKDSLDVDGILRGMSVLLVEDNIMNRQVVKFSVQKSGANIVTADHGQEAVDIVRKRFEEKMPNFDCILMDMMMPVMDGAQATVEIRELEKKFGVEPHLIIALSANFGPEFTSKVQSSGMNGSMTKPFYPAELRSTLAAVKNGTYKSGTLRTSVDKPGN